MEVFEVVIALLLAGAALAALARRMGAPYPALVALAGAALALVPGVPTLVLDPELALALFVAPVLVLLSFVVGPFPMALVFNGFELAAILLAVIIAAQVTHEGESTWFEGLQLLAVYAVLGLTFYFV